jgi:lycopene epsilon-cyclase
MQSTLGGLKAPGLVSPTLEPEIRYTVSKFALKLHLYRYTEVSKTLLSVRSLVDTLAEELQGGAAGGEVDADAVAEKVWRSVWPDDELRMRTFMCFGMETLMELDIKGTRQFFETFFQMGQDIWGGFLSWRIKPAGLVRLGAVLFFKFSNYMRFNFVWSALPFMASFVKNFATADNSFNSDKWGGLVLKKAEGPETVPGQGPIPRPDAVYNPAAEPITSSPLDFTELVGGDMDTPRTASSLRPDREWIEFQQLKVFKDQAPIVDILERLKSGETVDALVVGAGPAGLAVAAEMAERGVSVGLIAPDTPFVNNYGVWLDEFKELGLEHCLLHKYDDALVWFNDKDPAEGIGLGRGYGQVCRRRLRAELLGRCERAGVKYAPGLVDTLAHGDADEGEPSVVTGTLNFHEDAAEAAEGGERPAFEIKAKIVVCSTGHNRDMLKYEAGRAPGWQTAYGIEVKMPGHPFPINKAVFMDFRQSDPEVENEDPDNEFGIWRVPSFLYVLPVDKDTVFVEETCLVARVQVPFDELKRRLYRRLSRMGLSVEKENIIEEEASWIPLGGTPPVAPQRTLAYGAAAGLVHPASGFSIVNSLRRAPKFAEAVVAGLNEGGSVAAAERGWDVLWGDESRRQVGFYQFGMELLMSLRIEQMRNFFTTFFALPQPLSAGFLSNDLSSVKLIQFALTCFIIGNWELRALLLTHLASAGAGARLGQAYAHPLLKAAGLGSTGQEEGQKRVELNRKAPPQEPNFSSFAKDLFSAEEQGMMSGFQGKNWWDVGSGDQASSKDDDDPGGGGSGGSSSGGGGGGGRATMELQAAGAGARGGDGGGVATTMSSSTAAVQRGGAGENQGAMAYWSNGSAALVVASAVRKSGLTTEDCYGDGRKKFLPAALLSLAGEGVVPPYLTGTMPGDVGWDPLQMGAQRDIMKLREREIIHGRWAMLAAIGVLTPEICAKLSIFGSPGQHWWNTAVVWNAEGGIPDLTYLGETIPWGVAW